MKMPLKQDYSTEIQSAINYVVGTATTGYMSANELLAIVRGWMHEVQTQSKSALKGVELKVHAPVYHGKVAEIETVAYIRHDAAGWYIYDIKREPVNGKCGIEVLSLPDGLAEHLRIIKAGGFSQSDTGFIRLLP